MKVNINKLMFSMIIIVFIFCERCEFLFGWLDKLHDKHYLLMLAILIGILVLRKKKNLKCVFEVKTIFLCSVFLYIISIFYQVLNGSFKIYALEEFYYLIAPLILVFIIFNLN